MEQLNLQALSLEQSMKGGGKVGKEEKWMDLYEWNNCMSPCGRGLGNNVQNVNPINASGVLGKMSSMTNCTINFN